MTKTNYRATERLIFGKTILAVLMVRACTAWSHAQIVSDEQESNGQPATTQQYVYWTNSDNGSIGRATTTGAGATETFIPSGPVGGAGLTVNGSYIYWTSANGGSATTIARANLNGTGVNRKFITGAHNPCGVAVNSSYIYWAGDVGSSIGRANLNGTDVNQHFISGCGSGIAIQGDYIYFTASSGNAIGRANLDGSDVDVNFIPNLKGEIAFLAADSNYIFWADWGSRGNGTTIGRANLNGTDVNQSFIKGAKGGFGIAVTGGNP